MSIGNERNRLEETLHVASQTSGRAKLLEASIEATFQPVLQWYLLYPSLLKILVDSNPLSKQNLNTLSDYVQYVSIIMSILSLAWAFTAHKANYKHGALDVAVAPVSRAVLFFSDLFLIVARMNCLVIFMYSFGPGQFYPGMIFLAIHFGIMVILHTCFTSELTLLKECHYVRFIHGCLLNGLANMFSNNGDVIMVNRDSTKKKKTLVRHAVYDFVFLMELIILAIRGYGLDIAPIEHMNAKNTTITISICCHLFGFLLKIVYYTKLHVWSDLINVLQKKDNGDWMFETTFTFFGNENKVTTQIPIKCFKKEQKARTIIKRI